jgi:PAS domain-containing protein
MEISKSQTQFSKALERLPIHLQKAQTTLAELRKSAERTAERAQGWWASNLPTWQGQARKAGAKAQEQLRALAPVLFTVHEYGAVGLESARTGLRSMGRVVGDGLKRAQCFAQEQLPKLRAGAQRGVAAAGKGVLQFGTRVGTASKLATVHLREARNKAMKAGQSAGENLRVAGNAAGKECRRVARAAHEELMVAKDGAVRVGSQISAAAVLTGQQVQRAEGAVVRLGKNIADTPRRLREARTQRESDLLNLLENSTDAIVVTDLDRRLTAANPQALDLLGISECNMAKFTIDAFLMRGIAELSESRRSAEDDESAVHCKIRRLDGGMRVADCVFVAEILPRRHLYKFLNAGPQRIRPFALASSALRSAPRVERIEPANKIPRHGVRPVF